MPLIECPICFEYLKDPIATPCGHLCCNLCMDKHIQNSEDPFQANCPTCRVAFPIVTPILEHMPEKYRKFVGPTLRRIYIPGSEQVESLESLMKDNERLSALNASLERDKHVLVEHSARSRQSVQRHQESEQMARAESRALQQEKDDLQRQIANLQNALSSSQAGHSAAHYSTGTPWMEPAVRADYQTPVDKFSQSMGKRNSDAAEFHDMQPALLRRQAGNGVTIETRRLAPLPTRVRQAPHRFAQMVDPSVPDGASSMSAGMLPLQPSYPMAFPPTLPMLDASHQVPLGFASSSAAPTGPPGFRPPIPLLHSSQGHCPAHINVDTLNMAMLPGQAGQHLPAKHPAGDSTNAKMAAAGAAGPGIHMSLFY